MTTPTEVHTNEAARQSLLRMKAAAAKLGEAAAMAEQARAATAAEGAATGDAMAAIRFDAGATAAVADINDVVGNDTLSRWSEAADVIGSAATAGLAALEKYKDAEDVVASNNVDGRTLEPSDA